jgi:SpoVK/Ycf46/Vps4 family AAA+-type ATPase
VQISAGDLSAQAEQLEVQLTRTFRVASNWKAVLLLDEADVYLQRRDGLQLERNRLVATFLRTLEYYPGIFFLTTNMLQDFDAAILDRIQLKLQYHDLDLSARQGIFRHFCDKTGADVLEDEICSFAQVSLNGRQVRDSVRPEMYAYTYIIYLKIKNVIKLAHNVAMSEGVPLRADHIRSALRANGYTIPTPGSKIDNSLYDY